MVRKVAIYTRVSTLDQTIDNQLIELFEVLPISISSSSISARMNQLSEEESSEKQTESEGIVPRQQS